MKRASFGRLGLVALIVGLGVVLGLPGANASPVEQPSETRDLPYTPVITPNGSTLPWTMVEGVKEFRLTIDVIDWEVAPGMVIKAWGYNGRTPGPTIETVEGDHVRIYVTNNLPEPSAVHWHGILLPSGMDGVGGLTQEYIPPRGDLPLRVHPPPVWHPDVPLARG